MTNQEYVNSLYQHLLLRPSDDTGLTYWTQRLDTGLATRAQVNESFLNSNELQLAPSALASVYMTILGRQPDTDGLQFWAGLYRAGASIAQIAQQISTSPEYQARYGNLPDNGAKINQFYHNALGREADAGGLAFWLGELNKGSNLGSIAAAIALSDEGKARNSDAMKKTLLWHAIIGGEPSQTQLDSLPNDNSALAVAIMQLPNSEQFNAATWESFGTLYSNIALDDAVLTINLPTNQLTLGEATLPLKAGAMANVQHVDVHALTKATSDSSSSSSSTSSKKATTATNSASTSDSYSVHFTGDQNNNRYTASDLGDMINAGKGNDTITLGKGKDMLIFASNAADNGLDTINNFTLGNDILNISAFLNKTTANVTMVPANAEQPLQKNWLSGDLLVVQGTQLQTSQDIAKLFGVGGVYAAPQGASKTVLISANVTGNATLWYIANTQDTSNITANEVQAVAVLNNVNNLLDQDTLASLLASTQVSSAETDPNTLIRMQEINGTLYVSGELPNDLRIDIGQNTVFSGNSIAYLQAGTLTNSHIIDLSQINPAGKAASVQVTGSQASEIFIAGDIPTTLRGGGGVDGFLLNSGSHKLVFESTAAANGIDVISHFSLGAGGDILDFSAFLKKTGKTHIATQSADSTRAYAWNNGDVLVVQGDGINTANDIAALFGAGSAFAAPRGQAKAVVISSNIDGDATVWYITNKAAGSVNSIEANEVEQVAVLQDTNNLLLVGFHSDNFA